MNQSVVFLPVVGIRVGALLEDWADPSDNEVWSYAGPCCICGYWENYGDAGDYCQDCNQQDLTTTRKRGPGQNFQFVKSYASD